MDGATDAHGAALRAELRRIMDAHGEQRVFEELAGYRPASAQASALLALCVSNYEVQHRVGETVVSRIFGIESGKRALRFAVGREFYLPALAVLTTAYICVTYAAFFDKIPPAAFVALTIIQTLFGVIMFFTVFDTRIIKALCREWVFFGAICIQLGYFLCFSAIVQFDFRSIITMPSVLLVLYTMCMDAAPTYYRFTFAVPFSLALFAVMLSTLFIVNLGVMPNITDNTFQASAAQSLAIWPVTYDVLSLFNTLGSMMLLISAKLLAAAVNGMFTMELSILQLPLVGHENDYPVKEAGEWFAYWWSFFGVFRFGGFEERFNLWAKDLVVAAESDDKALNSSHSKRGFTSSTALP